MDKNKLYEIVDYKEKNNIDLPTTATHFKIGVNRLRKLLHQHNIKIPKRIVSKKKETIEKIRKSNLISKNSPYFKYDWQGEYDRFIECNKKNKTIGIKKYCEDRGYHPRYLREYIRKNNLHQPIGIPKRTEEWKRNISKSHNGIGRNPKGSNGKLKGKKLSKKHRDNIQAGLVKHYYNMSLDEWKSITDDKILYYKEVWRITNQQPLHLLENYDKRGNSGLNDSYQIDHIYPISVAFLNNIPPEKVGHISNLQMLPWYENRIKSNNVFLLKKQTTYIIDTHT